MPSVPASNLEYGALLCLPHRGVTLSISGDLAVPAMIRRMPCIPACLPRPIPHSRKMTRMPQRSPESSTVLIVERDQSVRKLQTLFLERAGFTLEFADDGACALEWALHERPAAVITEILVPKMDGLALCRALREDPRTRATPIIVFSILGAAQRAHEAGATMFLRKPLVDTTFVAAVQTVTAVRPPIAVVENQ